METKHRKMEDVLQELGKKLDKMFQHSELSKVEWKKEVDQRVEEVRRNIDTLENKTREVLGDNERWEEVEEKIRSAAHQFREAVEAAFKGKESKGSENQEV